MAVSTKPGAGGGPVQVDRAVQYHPGHLHGRPRRVDRVDRAAGHLPGDQPRPAPAGQHRLPAVDADGLPGGDRGAGGDVRPAGRHLRSGPHVQRRVCCLQLRVPGPVAVLVEGGPRRVVADRVAGCSRHRRGAADVQLNRHLDRRLPGRGAGDGHGDQHGGGHRRLLHRPGAGRGAGGGRLAGGVLGQMCRSGCSAPCGLISSCARPG
jgi:hypothetical protein